MDPPSITDMKVKIPMTAVCESCMTYTAGSRDSGATYPRYK